MGQNKKKMFHVNVCASLFRMLYFHIHQLKWESFRALSLTSMYTSEITTSLEAYHSRLCNLHKCEREAYSTHILRMDFSCIQNQGLFTTIRLIMQTLGSLMSYSERKVKLFPNKQEDHETQNESCA